MKKTLMATLLAGLIAPCVCITVYCEDPEANRGPGPEITGNYANCYLYSETTKMRYADPAYYNAAGALNRWHQIRGRAQRPVYSAPAKRVTIEK